MIKLIMQQQKFEPLLIFQLILKESPKYFKSPRFIGSKLGLFKIIYLLVIFTWILIFAVFTYIFSCSMLLFFIKFKPVKLVESLEDALIKLDINVAGRFTIQQIDSDLLKRAEKYEKFMKIGDSSLNPSINFITIDILKDIITGKTVVLANTFAIENMINEFQDYNLVTAERKYSKLSMAHSVLKDHTFSREITNA